MNPEFENISLVSNNPKNYNHNETERQTSETILQLSKTLSQASKTRNSTNIQQNSIDSFNCNQMILNSNYLQNYENKNFSISDDTNNSINRSIKRHAVNSNIFDFATDTNKRYKPENTLTFRNANGSPITNNFIWKDNETGKLASNHRNDDQYRHMMNTSPNKINDQNNLTFQNLKIIDASMNSSFQNEMSEQNNCQHQMSNDSPIESVASQTSNQTSSSASSNSKNHENNELRTQAGRNGTSTDAILQSMGILEDKVS